ncbi:uncharacterized protein LOC126966961 [Leptidea sinapis]|uniref:uncharacterized protein LOC126966961 n=1 Tax=Leptidea sinapis TaxID=189913 RepID=UPI0021C44960|nr:uncharacterized protein LOC126966961 [Leptidea sinapis]
MSLYRTQSVKSVGYRDIAAKRIILRLRLVAEFIGIFQYLSTALLSLAIGLSFIFCQCADVTYTGCLNSVNSLGPAVIMNH